MRRGGVLAALVAASLCVSAPMIGTAAAAAPRAGASPGARPPSPDQRAIAARAMRTIAGSARNSARSALKAPALAFANAALPTVLDVSDLPNDNGPDFDPRGDLIDTGIATNATTFEVGSFTDQFDDPTTSSNWQDQETDVEWGLDVNGDGNPDFIVAMFNDTADGLGVVAGVTNSNGSVFLCGAARGWDASVNGYFAQFPRSCVTSPPRTQVQGFMIYSTSPSDYSEDITDWSGAVAPPPPAHKPPPVVHGNGYWMLGADGHVYAFGGAKGFSGFVAGAVAMAPRRDGTGYWVVDRAGHVFSYGTAHFYGGTPALGAGEIVSTISTTQNDAGYWLFTNKGRAFPFGNAGRFGDMSGTPLNGPIVASVATPTGRGYYMVGSDGGIFSFGDARFHGSTGGIHLNKPVVGISPTPDSRGYWLVASDGGVFAFAAPFRGSMGAATLNRPVDGLVAFGNGYLMAASDGGIFDFSNKPFEGSLAEHPPTAPIIGVAAFSS
jgi:hypothetical protein